MKKLSEYFDRKNPVSLQDEVIFNFIYYFGQRGRESIRNLTKENVIFNDSADVPYVELHMAVSSKNVKASLSRKTYSNAKQCKMYELKDNSQKCPVTALRIYFQKLSKTSCLFPRPLQSYSDEVWYSDKAVRGKDYLGNLMKSLTQRLNLSKTILTTAFDQRWYLT